MYLLDANVFINASRQYYAPDIAPRFWDWLASEHAKGNLGSVEAVKNELIRGEGHLKDWATNLPNSFWTKPDAATPTSMAALSAWAIAPERPYTAAAKSEFFAVADYYLVAQAHAGGHRVATFELPAPNSKKRILIPDACDAMSVQCENPFSLYRHLGLNFN